MTTMTGTVQNGIVVLDGGPVPPDGTRVTVAVAEPAAGPPADPPDAGKPTMAWMLKYAGVLDDMPADFAEQHDHYIHGTPRR